MYDTITGQVQGCGHPLPGVRGPGLDAQGQGRGLRHERRLLQRVQAALPTPEDCLRPLPCHEALQRGRHRRHPQGRAGEAHQ